MASVGGEGVRAQVGHIGAIDALRALAVTWVVLFHWSLLRELAAPDPWNAFLAAHAGLGAVVRSGYLGVDLFFLITGFLLVLPWARGPDAAAVSVREYYVRRIRRIVPAYYVHLLLLFLVFVPLLRGADFLRDKVAYLAFNAAAHASFLHYTNPISSASLSLNGALWTLSLEAQFYLLLPLWAALFVRRPWLLATLLVAAAGAWRWLALHDLAPLVALQMALGARGGVDEPAVRHLLLTQLPAYLGHFAAGMGIGLWWWRRRAAPASGTEKAAWLAAAVAAFVLLVGIYGTGLGAVLGPILAWSATLAALATLFAAALRAGRASGGVSGLAPVRCIGLASYSIYLYHVPLLLLFNHLGWLRGSAWALPAYLFAVLVVGALSYRFVERPFLRGRPAAASGAR